MIYSARSVERLVRPAPAVLLVLLTGCSSTSTLTGTVTTMSADRICVGRPAAAGHCFTGVPSKDRQNLKIGDCVKVTYQPGSQSAPGRAIQVAAIGGAAAARECP